LTIAITTNKSKPNQDGRNKVDPELDDETNGGRDVAAFEYMGETMTGGGGGL